MHNVAILARSHIHIRGLDVTQTLSVKLGFISLPDICHGGFCSSGSDLIILNKTLHAFTMNLGGQQNLAMIFQSPS